VTQSQGCNDCDTDELHGVKIIIWNGREVLGWRCPNFEILEEIKVL
jgi:hypothetical protein